jgi:hypothetical protein
MDGQNRSSIHPGIEVQIIQKKDQSSGFFGSHLFPMRDYNACVGFLDALSTHFHIRKRKEPAID